MFLILNLCYYVDLDEDVFGKGLNSDAGAGGLSYKVLTVHLVKCGEVSHIRKEADRLDCLFDICACRFQYLAEVFADLLGLSFDGIGLNVTCSRVYCDLTRGEDEVSDLYGLRIGSDGLGGVFGIDFFTHFGFSFDGRSKPLPYVFKLSFIQIYDISGGSECAFEIPPTAILRQWVILIVVECVAHRGTRWNLIVAKFRQAQDDTNARTSRPAVT